MTTLAPCEFDSAIFGFPWYRLGVAEFDDLERHVAVVRASVPAEGFRAGLDTKIPAQDTALRDRFMRQGFQEVCMQLTWERDLTEEDAHSGDVAAVKEKVPLSEAERWRHAQGFFFDRFHQDPGLPSSLADAIFFKWISNSLSGAKLVSVREDGFCTFEIRESSSVIDLVSVIRGGQGTGTHVVQQAITDSARRGARLIHVTTEAANERAWKLYQRLGFRLVSATRNLHLHLPDVHFRG